MVKICFALDSVHCSTLLLSMQSETKQKSMRDKLVRDLLLQVYKLTPGFFPLHMSVILNLCIHCIKLEDIE